MSAVRNIVGSVPTALLLAGGALGAVMFVAVFTVLGVPRSGYDEVRHFISILSLGDGGWAQIVNFLVGGALIVGLGIGLARRWQAGPGSRWVPGMVTLAGIGLAWCGVFIPDPSLGYPPGTPDVLITPLTWHGALHYLGATSILLTLTGAVLLTIRRGLVLGERLLAAVSIGTAIFAVGGCGLVILLGGPDPIQLVGLLERIGVFAGWAWLALVATLELRTPRQLR